MPRRVYTQILHTTNVVQIYINGVDTKIIKTLTRSLGTIDECFTNIAVCEHARGTDIVPIFTSERVDAENKKYNTFKKRSASNTPGHDNFYTYVRYGYVHRKTVYNLHLLLQAFLAAFGQPLVLSNSHNDWVSKFYDPKQSEELFFKKKNRGSAQWFQRGLKKIDIVTQWRIGKLPTVATRRRDMISSKDVVNVLRLLVHNKRA